MATKKKAKKTVKKEVKKELPPQKLEDTQELKSDTILENQEQIIPPSTESQLKQTSDSSQEKSESSDQPEQPSTPTNSSPMSPIAQATPAPLKQAWLILSGDKSKFGDRMALVDILNNAGLPGDKKSQARGLWMCLADAGFILHPGLEDQYRKQKTCMFCGGMIISRATKTSREDKCDDCDYLYFED